MRKTKASPPLSPPAKSKQAPKRSTRGKTISALEVITLLAFDRRMDEKALWQYEQEHDIGVYRSEPFKWIFDAKIKTLRPADERLN